jgi:hypothetical protein
MNNERVCIGDPLPFDAERIKKVKLFVFGDTWWPRPRVGVSPSVQNSIDREKRWREQDQKFKHGLSLLGELLLEDDFIDRAVIQVEQEKWMVWVMISKWVHGQKARVRVVDYCFSEMIDGRLGEKFKFDLEAAHSRLERFIDKNLTGWKSVV